MYRNTEKQRNNILKYSEQDTVLNLQLWVTSKVNATYWESANLCSQVS